MLIIIIIVLVAVTVGVAVVTSVRKSMAKDPKRIAEKILVKSILLGIKNNEWHKSRVTYDTMKNSFTNKQIYLEGPFMGKFVGDVQYLRSSNAYVVIEAFQNHIKTTSPEVFTKIVREVTGHDFVPPEPDVDPALLKEVTRNLRQWTSKK